MSKKLVIVESPAKAKTIRQFLGADYDVQASVGHIRDLFLNGKTLPAEHRKKWWADYAVDVDNNFEPFYEVPGDKKRHVDTLRGALKGATEIVLATDEDREGESISWHLLQVLKPAKSVAVKRIAFHEITRDAIFDALKNPREIDMGLVEAQEARRILDRLYGYTLSPVLWSRVAKELSAGRVQTPAVKLVVDREKRRREFHASIYFDLKADLEARGQRFPATLRSMSGQKIATGTDFDEQTGQLKSAGPRILSESEAAVLAPRAEASKPWRVVSAEKTPGQENPPAPFRTTTLQQEANRKFGFRADRTMRLAQDLYEGVDLGGERVGLITYMRTDSLSLAESAVRQAREAILGQFGQEHVPDKPNRYASKVANAQEAHEAIRPTDIHRTPDSIRRALHSLSDAHFKLYDLVYRRTLACQMKPAKVLRTSAQIDVEVDGATLGFSATGKEITFPGFHLAYVEDVDDPDAELEERERVLPELKVGQDLLCRAVEASRHETKPPARYTDATLIKALEDLGIGRPSTYATILSVIEDRGYVRKEKKQLVPTWLAFLAMETLESHFGEFMDLRFTATMDEALDAIANGKVSSKDYLRRFFLGENGHVGLKPAVDQRKRGIPYPAIPIGGHPDSGEPIVVRWGKDGRPFLQLGEKKRFASIPEGVAPDEMTVQRALELFAGKPEEPDSIGAHPESGRRLLLKKRDGYYLEVERTPEELATKSKPVWVGIPRGVDPRSLTQQDLDYLCRLPVEIGRHPDSGEPILFRIGKYGPYIQCGPEMRTAPDWRGGLTMSVEDCLALLAMDKRAAARSTQPRGPILELGKLEGASGPVRVMPGRFGPYVTDGTVNATLPKNLDPASLTPEQAVDLLQKKAAAGPAKPRGKFRSSGSRAQSRGRRPKRSA